MSLDSRSPWQVLGVEPGAPVAEVRRCYAARIRQYRPDSHPEGFARVRAAYETVLPLARRRAAEAVPAPVDAAVDIATREGAEPAPRLHVPSRPERPGEPPTVPPPRVDGRSPTPPAASEAEPVRVCVPSLTPEPLPAPPTRVDGGFSPPRAGPAAEPVRVRVPGPVVLPHPAHPARPPVVDARPPPPGLPVPTAELPEAPPAESIPALRRTFETRGELAALDALHRLLRHSRRGAIDDRQTIESGLLQWFLSSDRPPLLLMFDAGREFGWHRQERALGRWLSAEASRRLERLLVLSRDLVYARQITGNRWLRRLFTPEAKVPWFGLGLPMVEAAAWESRWRANVEVCGPPALLDCIGGKASRRVGGAAVLSTDLGVAFAIALLLAWLLADSASGSALSRLLGGPTHRIVVLLLALGGAILIALLRTMARAAWRRPGVARRLAWSGRLVRSVAAHPARWFLFAMFLGTVLMAAVSKIDDTALAHALVVSIFTPLALAGTAFLLHMAWRAVRAIERSASGLWSWRESVDRWEYEKLLAADAGPPGSRNRRTRGPVLGERLGWRQRFQAIGEARLHEAGELARGERPPRVAVRRALRLPRLSWWMVICIVLALSRLIVSRT